MRKVMRLLTVCGFLFCVFMSTAALGESISDKLISIDVKDMEIGDVIRLIADQSGLNIVTSNNVRGKVSITLQDVKVDEALRAILEVNNATYVKEGNIIRVYTYPEYKQKKEFLPTKTKVFSLKYIKAADLKPLLDTLKSARGKVETEPKTNRVLVTDTPESLNIMRETVGEMDRPVETRIYRLSYADPVEIQKSLLEVVPKQEGEILVDPRTNSLVVTASPLLLGKMDVLIENWDKQIPQVLIEAKILQLTLGKGKFLGIEWQYQASRKNSITLGSGDLPEPSKAVFVEAFKFGVLDEQGYEVTINALENSDDVDLISSPRVVTLDGEEAQILIGSSEPYEVVHFDSEGRVTSKDLKFLDVGIKLIVTPKISEDGFITMNIHPEVSSARAGTVTDALAVDTTEATTILRIKDGNTIALGGLIKNDEETVISKIPVLGDIPFLGLIFRNHYTSKTKKEIIIFITPRILTSEEALTEREKQHLERATMKLKPRKEYLPVE